MKCIFLIFKSLAVTTLIIILKLSSAYAYEAGLGVTSVVKDGNGVNATMSITSVTCIHKCDEDINLYGAKFVGLVIYTCNDMNVGLCQTKGVLQYNNSVPVDCKNLDDCTQKSLAMFPVVGFKPIDEDNAYSSMICSEVYYQINNASTDQYQSANCIENNVVPESSCTFNQENYIIDYGRVEVNEVEGKEKTVTVNIDCLSGGTVNLSWTPLNMNGSEIATLRINDINQSGMDLKLNQGLNALSLTSTLKKLGVGTFSASSIMTLSYP